MTMDSSDDFESVRRERDPLKRAKLATLLLSTYQQRSVELARLRKEAISDAASSTGMTYTAIAESLGLTKGRVTQIRQSAPPAERAFFGVGPLTVALPLRASAERPLGTVAVEDAMAADAMTELLHSYQFQVERLHIPVGGEYEPPRETLAICGPKTSNVTAQAISHDPHYTFAPNETERWVITEKATGRTVAQAAVDSHPAYIGRLPFGDSTIFIVAGIHALGSLGAVKYLRDNAAALYSDCGDSCFSVIVDSRFNGTECVSSESLTEPRPHT